MTRIIFLNSENKDFHQDKTDSAKMFLNIEFPQVIDMDIPTSVVYFEENGDIGVEPPETNDLVTFPDPEIGRVITYGKYF